MTTPLLVPVKLDDQERGDDFDYSGTLGGGYTASMIDEMWFTLRTEVPDSTTTDDTGAVAQAKLSTDEITFSDDTNFSVVLPATKTTAWPNGWLLWDCQVRIAGTGQIRTIARGNIEIVGDITRST